MDSDRILVSSMRARHLLPHLATAIYIPVSLMWHYLLCIVDLLQGHRKQVSSGAAYVRLSFQGPCSHLFFGISGLYRIKLDANFFFHAMKV